MDRILTLTFEQTNNGMVLGVAEQNLKSLMIKLITRENN